MTTPYTPSLRILQIVHDFPPYNIAGTEVYTYNLSIELAKRHKVFIFHRINDKRKGEFEIIHNEHKGLQVYSINNTFKTCDSFEMIYNNEIITDLFSKFLNEINPDIVHVQHLLFLSIGIIEEIKKKGIPIVFTLNDYWLMCPQCQLLKKNLEVCQEHTLSDCIKCVRYQLVIKRGVMDFYWFLRNKLPAFLIQILKNIYFVYARSSFLSKKEEIKQIDSRAKCLRQICAMVDIFLAPSNFLRERFIDFGIPENKIILARYGLNTNLFEEFQKSLSGKIRFGFIGTLLPSKGAHILINAFNGIKRRNIELQIYGRKASYKGFEYYLKYLTKIGQNDNIHFMGGYNNEKIAEILSGIDILVVPSIWYENSPLVIQEAFLAKVPVIASGIGGIPELVNNGVNGLLFKPGDSKELREKLQYVMENPDFLKKAQENMPVVESIETHAKKIEILYSRLLLKRNNHETIPKGTKSLCL